MEGWLLALRSFHRFPVLKVFELLSTLAVVWCEALICSTTLVRF